MRAKSPLAVPILALLVSVACTSTAKQAFDRPASVPFDVSPDRGEVTLWGTNGTPVSVNGVPIEGQMTNTPEEVYVYRFSPMIGVPAGAQIVVGDARVPGEIRGWIDAWSDGSTPSERLYELDLGDTPTMPTEPGVYTLEFTVPDDADADFTFLFPICVVAPEEMGLAFSFNPYDVTHMVWVNGVLLPEEMNSTDTVGYLFAPGRRIEVPSARPPPSKAPTSLMTSLTSPTDGSTPAARRQRSLTVYTSSTRPRLRRCPASPGTTSSSSVGPARRATWKQRFPSCSPFAWSRLLSEGV